MEYDKFTKRYAYSMRRITISIVFPLTMMIGIYIVISDRLLGLKTVNVYAIQVFNSLLLFITVGLGMNLTAYLKNEKEKPKNEQENSNENIG